MVRNKYSLDRVWEKIHALVLISAHLRGKKKGMYAWNHVEFTLRDWLCRSKWREADGEGKHKPLYLNMSLDTTLHALLDPAEKLETKNNNNTASHWKLAFKMWKVATFLDQDFFQF